MIATHLSKGTNLRAQGVIFERSKGKLFIVLENSKIEYTMSENNLAVLQMHETTSIHCK